MQFQENAQKTVKCPVCQEVDVPVRDVREKPNYCSRKCASQSRYATRYQGSLSGPMDKPTLKEKTKFQ